MSQLFILFKSLEDSLRSNPTRRVMDEFPNEVVAQEGCGNHVAGHLSCRQKALIPSALNIPSSYLITLFMSRVLMPRVQSTSMQINLFYEIEKLSYRPI